MTVRNPIQRSEMYRAAFVWLTPLPRTAGNTRTTNAASTRPPIAGTITTRGHAGASEDPSRTSRVHSIASRKQTTARPE